MGQKMGRAPDGQHGLVLTFEDDENPEDEDWRQKVRDRKQKEATE